MDVDSLRQLIEQRFDSLDREMRDVKEDVREVRRQTTLTNGRVNGHDTAFGVMAPRLEALEDAARNPAQRVTTVTSTTTSGENRGITQRDVWLVLGTSGVLWTVLKVAGLISGAATP